MATTKRIVLLSVLAAFGLVLDSAQASRGFMVLEENRPGRDSSTSSAAATAAAAQDPGQILYQLFGQSSAGAGGFSPMQSVRQLVAQPVQNLMNQQPPSFGSMGNQLDSMLASGYDQATRRVQQMQLGGSSSMADGQQLLRQMYEMLMNPEEMCRQLARQATPPMQAGLDQTRAVMQAAASGQMSQLPSPPVSSMFTRYMGKK